jgi:hypothetical protein
MKKIILITMLLIISTFTFSQQNTPTPTLTKQDYLQKSKHQKSAAWILLGGGLVCTSLGSIRFKPDDDWGGGNNQPSTGSTVFLVTGLAAISSSITLFIFSSKNKRKSMSMSFENQMTPQLQKSSFVYRVVPSLTLKIGL